MAYIDHRTGKNQRVAAMAVVGLIQGAAIIALINGFTVSFLKPAVQLNPQSADVPITMPIDMPPPPPAKPTPDVKTQIEVAIPQVEVDGSQVVDWPPAQKPAEPVIFVQPTLTPLPQPEPAPTFPPRAAHPRNAPGNWATANDYPARDLREGNQGVTGFSLTVGVDGRVQSCTITASSGFPGLDKATCDNVSRRAHFDPATDGSGNLVASTYSNKIRWLIPRG